MSTYSMTGFGSSEMEAQGWRFSCEVKTLNSRFLETNIRISRSFLPLEPQIIQQIKTQLTRGKVDVFFNISPTNSTENLPTLNKDAVKHYAQLANDLRHVVVETHTTELFSVGELTSSEFLSLEGVLNKDKSAKLSEEKRSELQVPLIECLNAALAEVKAARGQEGRALNKAVLEMIANINTDIKTIVTNVSDIRSWVHDNYTRRLTKVLEDLENTGKSIHRPPEERIMSEISMLVEKADIEEETTRLSLHTKEFEKILVEGGVIGRKLDFLCQEMHRETNTISSKIQDTEISKAVLNIKQTIERIKQQIANIE